MSREKEKCIGGSCGSLDACLVGGDAQQQSQHRRLRRRALLMSITIQSALLAALLLIPLFGTMPRIAVANVIPTVPYTPLPVIRPIVALIEQGRRSADPGPSFGQQHASRPIFPKRNLVEPNRPPIGDTIDPVGDPTSGCSGCADIGRTSSNLIGPGGGQGSGTPALLHRTHLDPAMLIYRVEPVYPPLARQTGRAGTVELRAIISTDGTIRSLQVASGDPLFYLSAIDAVRDWRYKPTVLNGQPVEVETFITVIYSMAR